MKKQVLSIFLCLSAITGISTNSNAQSTVVYYWDFNAGDSSIHTPSYTAAGSAGANYQYWATYTDFTTGSSINTQMGSIAGNCIRFRNPSDSVTFFMPTTGYKNLQFSYVEQRTGSGARTNTVKYTTDGVHFVSTSIADATIADSSTYTIDSTNAVSGDTTEFEKHSFTFSGDAATINNPHFAVTIIFNGAYDSSSGNNRFDNVVLKGDVDASAGVASVVSATNYSIFPDPAVNVLNVVAATATERSIAIYNLVGQKVYEGIQAGNEFSINTANLVSGAYFISIREANTGVAQTMRFVKQ